MSTTHSPIDHLKIYAKAHEITEKFVDGDAFEVDGHGGGFDDDWFAFMLERKIVSSSDTSDPWPRHSTTSEIDDLRSAERLLCRGGESDQALALRGVIRSRVFGEIALPLAYALGEDPNFARDFQIFEEARRKEQEKAYDRAQAEKTSLEAQQNQGSEPAAIVPVQDEQPVSNKGVHDLMNINIYTMGAGTPEFRTAMLQMTIQDPQYKEFYSVELSSHSGCDPRNLSPNEHRVMERFHQMTREAKHAIENGAKGRVSCLLSTSEVRKELTDYDSSAAVYHYDIKGFGNISYWDVKDTPMFEIRTPEMPDGRSLFLDPNRNEVDLTVNQATTAENQRKTKPATQSTGRS